MSFRRLIIGFVACLAALTLGATLASAAKAPTYHVYKKCSTKIDCSVVGYFNAKQTRAVTVSIGKRCSDRSFLSISFSGSAKVSKKGKFTAETTLNNWDTTANQSVKGSATIKGTLTKKNKKKYKLTLKYTADGVPAACAPLAKGTETAKYKGTQTGG